MSGPPRFGADELGPTEGTELDDVLEAVRELESVAADVPVRARPGFADRVMAALADEPSPAAAGFLVPIRRRGVLAGFAESVRQAWASIGAGRPALTRAAALAYVLVVALAGTSLAGAATFGAAGAFGLLEPHQTSLPSPEPSLPPETPAPSVQPPSPSIEAEPSDTPEPSESDDHGGGSGAEPSDDHGGDVNSGDGPSEDESESSDDSSGPHETDDHTSWDNGSGDPGASFDD